MNRRGFLAGVLAAGIAPYVVTTAGVLMPVRDLWKPSLNITFNGEEIALTIDDFARTYLEPTMRQLSDDFFLGSQWSQEQLADMPIRAPITHNMIRA